MTVSAFPLFVALLAFSATGWGQNLGAQATPGDTLWIIPHTHWEGAVFKTREEYLDMGLTNILKALRLLKTHPHYRFTLDHAAYVKPFLERYPEQEADFRKFLGEGRLEIAGGTNTMHDNNIPSGESIVRQFLYGKGYFHRKLGIDVTSGWGLDTFGHNAQMPQLLKLAGFESYWYWRGAPKADIPSEFFWQGIDGSRIPAFRMPHGYSLLYGSPPNLLGFSQFAIERFRSIDPQSNGPDRFALAGADVSDPEEHLPVLAEKFNEAGGPFKIRLGTPKEFASLIAKRYPQRPVIEGEFNPIFQGVYSSRIEVKQWMRELERSLTTAEKLAVVARWSGAPAAGPEELIAAWEPVLFNQAHDLSSGVMVDKVYEESIASYRFSKRLADGMIDQAIEGLSGAINTSGEGSPIVVFNTLGWPRTDVVEVNVGFTSQDAQQMHLFDHQGNAVPLQVLAIERHGDGDLRHARIAFIARDVPAMGYSVYHLGTSEADGLDGNLQSATTRRTSGTPAYQDTALLENDHYSLNVDLWTGAIQSLRVKDGGWEALRGPANVVALEQDGGDFWELYGTLNGGRNVAMKKPARLPSRDRAQFSNEWVGGRTSYVDSGPVFSEARSEHPFGKGAFATSIRVYNGLRRIDIRTEILNQDELVRYRVLFPTIIQNGTNVQEIPFGAIERPTSIEFPAQNWIDYSDGKRGVTLLNRGLPGSNVAADGTMMISLLRSAKLLSYAFHGGYEPGVSSDSGLQIGKQFEFHYSVLPHSGDWRAAEPYRAGQELNNPLIARKFANHDGPLPARWGLLEVSHPNVAVSALKPGPEGSAVLRVYEASGRATQGARVSFRTGISAGQEADLIERATGPADVAGNALRFDIKPFEIKTYRLRLEPLNRR